MTASQRDIDIGFMREALVLAQAAEAMGEVPVGAIVVMGGMVVGRGHNQPIAQHDPSAHAEIMAIRDAAIRLENYRLGGATIYVTLEPCIMCAGAILQGRVDRLVYGARDERFGAAGTQLNLLESDFLNHKATVTGGVLHEECQSILQQFFQHKRSPNR